ncbi:LacI family transcriptional regulator [Mesorhizobium sp. M3A.F.Ca.ET.080.04.2.1]|uniref:LacI family DNA-binding transcriptional regulator n=1 Tax=Mesorhizobium sp. M3A.F.Ca.ET.080.04.2.1 TaxID=2493676 RepID=UPI000F74CF39|nr:LacI family DNA-binding transcriptional regulator [Mesorhizobium sp. M3A.F.Ca.ET.080.04.2.1]AZO07938.1 LacI family transcriptional regulator [Mesorhizobium sp. M3A.F.Ca.ET.080.04.2.1]RWF18410.1 MAG: LacI family transcriptional regulator [Mesorhizobium sp.]
MDMPKQTTSSLSMTTIHDVAKLAGVASGTASNVMAGKPGVSQAKQTAVREAARQLNYRPSSIARALSKRQSDMIGVLTQGFRSPFFARAVDVAEREIRLAGKHAVIASSPSQADSDWCNGEPLSFLDSRDCDGILVLGCTWSERELTQVLAGRTRPIVFVNRQLTFQPNASFSVDHYAVGHSIAEHLLRQGHRQFAAVKGPDEHYQDASLRHKGFVDTIAAAGFPVDPDLIIEGSLDFCGGKVAAERLLAIGRPFSAVCCGNDEQAIAAEAILSSTDHPPEIFGHGGWDLLSYIATKVSTVTVPIADIVESACASLLNQCYGGDRPVRRTFPTSLVIRRQAGASNLR